jgi:hypothetical protein
VVLQSRLINTTAPVTGGGDLSADRTLGLSVDPVNDGGAVARQNSTPGTIQTGYANLSGLIWAHEGMRVGGTPGGGAMFSVVQDILSAAVGRIETQNAGGEARYDFVTPSATSEVALYGSGWAGTGAQQANAAAFIADANAVGGLSIAAQANAPIRFYTNGIAANNERMRITGAGLFTFNASTVFNAGVSYFTITNNVSAPRTYGQTYLQIIGADAATPRVVIDGYGSGGVNSGEIVFRSAANTNASPTATQSNWYLWQLSGIGYGATGYASGSRAGIVAVSTENWSDTAQGAKLIFQTTKTAGNTPANSLTIENDGQLTNILNSLTGKNPGVFFVQTADKVTTANTLTSLFGTGQGTLTIPANFFAVGRTIRIIMGGYVSAADGGVGTKTLTLKLGGTTIATGTSLTTFATTLNYGWLAEAYITCRSIGAGGTVVGFSRWGTQIAGTNAYAQPTAQSLAPVTVNTTGSLALDLQFNNGNATGTVTTTFATVDWSY